MQSIKQYVASEFGLGMYRGVPSADTFVSDFINKQLADVKKASGYFSMLFLIKICPNQVRIVVCYSQSLCCFGLIHTKHQLLFQ